MRLTIKSNTFIAAIAKYTDGNHGSHGSARMSIYEKTSVLSVQSVVKTLDQTAERYMLSAASQPVLKAAWKL